MNGISRTCCNYYYADEVVKKLNKLKPVSGRHLIISNLDFQTGQIARMVFKQTKVKLTFFIGIVMKESVNTLNPFFTSWGVAVAEASGWESEGPAFEPRRLRATLDPGVPKKNNEWFPAKISVLFVKKNCKAHFKRFKNQVSRKADFCLGTSTSRTLYPETLGCFFQPVLPSDLGPTFGPQVLGSVTMHKKLQSTFMLGG